MARGRIPLGTGGWNYRSWRDDFYAGKPARVWLAHASLIYGSLEVNGSFYRQVRAETFQRWREETPAGFRFALKGHRFITHYRRLRDVRHAIELRHRSWFDGEVARRLREARIASCISDAPDFPIWRAVTTDLVYVRLHGHTRKYASSYRREHLSRWAQEIRAWSAEGRDVHVYLDNDAEGAAVRNALTLQSLLRCSSALSLRGARFAVAPCVRWEDIANGETGESTDCGSP